MQTSDPQVTAASRDTEVPELRSLSGLLGIACLFALMGGYLDAYSYLAHGHVFANAQTGNVVLFGVSAASDDWRDAAQHLPPIAAFICGVAAARQLRVQATKRTFPAMLICMAMQLIVLAMLAAMGATMPNALVVPAISFVAALQNTSFSKLGPWSFNSAMTTGNIRTATSGLMNWLLRQDRQLNRGQLIVAGSVAFSFAAGAVCGGIGTKALARYALLPCVAGTAVGMVLTWRQRRSPMQV